MYLFLHNVISLKIMCMYKQQPLLHHLLSEKNAFLVVHNQSK